MKKCVLSCLVVAMMLVTLLPVNIMAETGTVVTTEQELIDAVATGGEIDINSDITISQSIQIEKRWK